MKDTPIKSSPTLPLPIKSKPSLKKAKMAAKKMKEHKTPIMKVGKSKKVSSMDKKSKLNKDNLVPAIKRKRGRPRNEDRLHIKKPVKEQKNIKKCEDAKTVVRKRKVNDAKLDKEFVSGPLKKPKISDNNCNLNGDIKMPISPISKSFVQKGESPSVVNCTSNVINSNGTLHGKLFGNKKSLNILKSPAFNATPPKKELLNGNSNLAPFKFQPNKNKTSFKKDFEINSLSKEIEHNSKNEKINNFSFPPKESKEINGNDISKCHAKEIKPLSKDFVKPQAKESVKCLGKDFSKSQVKEPVKNQTKEATKPPVKEPAKTQTKDSVKSQAKDPPKSQLKEPTKCNSKESATKEPNKSQTKEVPKSQIKDPVKTQSKDSVKSTPLKDSVKSIPPKDSVKPVTPKDSVKPTTPKDSVKPTAPKESVKPTPPKEPIIKSHPMRMASLDAMARMHVICTTDRKPPEPKHSSMAVCQKSITQCHERIQVDVKKETNEFKGNIVHKQEINVVKEKQQVFVSHSVEQSSIVEREQSKTVSTKVQHEKEKKKKIIKPVEKPVTNDKKVIKNKVKPSPSNKLKLIEKIPKAEKCKPKAIKNKDTEKKNSKVQNKISKMVKSVKEKPDSKNTCKKTKKVEQQTKSEVKVKETIRMQKTCTYQSVTTVNSHGTSNSSVVPVSHVGMTTNFSKTKKTVVTDEECKNKVNYSTGSVINNSYCLTTESPCSVGPHTDCCKFRAHPQIIPVAHVQTCSLGHSLNRTSDTTPSSSHCDGSFPMHRFGHQQTVIFTPTPPECGCCCPSPLVQNVHDSCLLRKSIVAYPHHLPSHHSHHPAPAFSSETVCSDCHPSNTTLDAQRHHSQHYTISSPSHSRVACCACCELHRESNQHHHQSSLHYVSQPKTSSSIVPCEQSPLDLSLTSSTSNINIESDISLPQGHCSSPLCCRDLLLLRTSPHGFQHNKFTPNKSCCKCSNKQIVCETQAVDSVQSLSCSNKSIIKIGQLQPADHVTLLASPVGQGSVPPVASTSGVANKSVPHIITDDTLLTAKQEKSVSPKQSSKPPVAISKKRVFTHGWSWKGKPREKLIALTNDSVPCPRICYPSVQHTEGDTISERDCVLLRSGPKDTDLPYVAKVAAFWENPDDGEMMMSLLWYYRPEHTDQGRKPGQMEDEVFASRHKDVNSVACIEDKCYVLTYSEFCRYKANLSMDDDTVSLSSVVVPELPEGYPRKHRLPCEPVSQDIVFFCRHVYDFRQKRILKNPT